MPELFLEWNREGSIHPSLYISHRSSTPSISIIMQKTVPLSTLRCPSRFLLATTRKSEPSTWRLLSGHKCLYSSTSRKAQRPTQLAKTQPRSPQAPASAPRCQQKRPFTSTPRLPYKSVQEARSRYRSGVSPPSQYPQPPSHYQSTQHQANKSPQSSLSRGAPAPPSSPPASAYTSTSSTKRHGLRDYESPKRQRESDGRRWGGSLSWWIRMGGRLRSGI